MEIKEINRDVRNLFAIAEEAKKIRAYDIANKCFEILMSFAYLNKGELKLVYEKARDWNIVDALSDPNGFGYHDLVAVAKGKEYLCIPLPLVTQACIDAMLIRGLRFVKKHDHNREFVEIAEDERLNEISRLTKRFEKVSESHGEFLDFQILSAESCASEIAVQKSDSLEVDNANN